MNVVKASEGGLASVEPATALEFLSEFQTFSTVSLQNAKLYPCLGLVMTLVDQPVTSEMTLVAIQRLDQSGNALMLGRRDLQDRDLPPIAVVRPGGSSRRCQR